MPRIRTLLFFVAIAELALFVVLGRLLGGATMLVWAAVAGVAGWLVAKREGAKAIRGWQAATARGELPTGELAESGTIVIAGALLMIPGPLTDVVALTLLLPPVRRRVTARLRTALSKDPRVGASIANAVTRGAPRVIDLDADDVREN